MQPIRESVDSLCRDDTNAQYMQKSLKIEKDIGVAWQKLQNQDRDDIKVKACGRVVTA